MYKQNPQKKKLWISLLFISCVWFIFYDLKTLFSDHLYVITNDTLQYFWTEITFTVNSIKEFRIPLWNPFIEFGEPHISRSFTVFFSPITILLSNILSARAIYILNSTLPVFVGSLGVLILTKNIYSLSASASLISAISFLNCGINQAQSYHLSFVFGFSFLPWIFYSIESLLVHKVYKGHVLLTIMFSIVFLCANPQYIFYNIIASILYFIVRIYTNNKYNQGSERNVNDRKAKRIWFTDLQPAQKVIHIRLPLKGLLYFGTFFILMGVILNEGYLAFLFSKDGIIQSKIYLVYIRGYQVFTIGLGTVLIIKFIKKSFDNKYNQRSKRNVNDNKINRIELTDLLPTKKVTLTRLPLVVSAFVSALAIASLIGAIQTLMTFDLFEDSYRSTYTDLSLVRSNFSLHSFFPLFFIFNFLPTSLIRPIAEGSHLITSSLFIAVIPAVLASTILIARGALIKYKSMIVSLVILYCLGWFVSAGIFNPIYYLLIKIVPNLGAFSFNERALFISTVSVSLLAGFGYDLIFGKYSKYCPKKTYNFIAVLLGILIICNAYYGLYLNRVGEYLFNIGIYMVVIHLILIAIFIFGFYHRGYLGKKSKSLFIVTLFVLLAFQIEYVLYERAFNVSIGGTENQFNNKANVTLLYKENQVVKLLKDDGGLFRIMPYRPYDSTYDMGFYHFGRGKIRGVLSTQIIPMTWGQVFELSSIGTYHRGYHSHLSPLDATRLIDLAYNKLYFADELSILSMINVKYILSTDILDHQELELISSFRDVLPGFEFNSRFFEKGPVYVYRNPNVWERIFLASKIKYVDYESTSKYIQENHIERHTAIVNDRELTELTSSSINDSISKVKYEYSKIEINCKVEKSALLVVSDHLSKGWRYFINDVEVGAYRVNNSFRGIVLPAGESVVSMRYLPDSFVIGLRMMATGIVCLVLSTIYLRRKVYMNEIID